MWEMGKVSALERKVRKQKSVANKSVLNFPHFKGVGKDACPFLILHPWEEEVGLDGLSGPSLALAARCPIFQRVL